MDTIFDFLLYLCTEQSKINRIFKDLSDNRYKKIKEDPKKILYYLNFKEIITFNNIPKCIFKSQHSTVYRCAKSPLGYAFDNLKSALQKYIRRGEVDNAIFVANELYAFRLLEGGKPFYTNFINRIKVITLEDIGIANPKIVIMIDSLLDELSDNEPSLLVNWNIIHKIIATLCNSLHYRFYSHLGTHVRGLSEDDLLIKYNPEKESQKFVCFVNMCIDQREHREFDKWIIQISLCWEYDDVHIYYWIMKFFQTELKLKVRRFNSNKPRYLAMYILSKLFESKNSMDDSNYIFAVCLKWLKELNLFEAFLCAMHPAICRITGINSWDGDVENISIKQTRHYIKKNLTYKRIVFEDYVIDKHTKAGRMFGRSTADFAVEGSLIAYEHGSLKEKFDREMHSNYINVRVAQFPTSETSVFTLKAKAQLICGNARTDVYYATLKSDKSDIVVKGPYGSFESVNRIYQICKIMKLFPHVNVPNVNVKLLTLDMFPDISGKGIGIRKKLLDLKITAGYFLIFEDVFKKSEYPTIKKSSKVWPATDIVDYDTVFADKDIGFGIPSMMTIKGRISLIHQLCFRYMFEMGDFASRNFCYSHDKAYNLDIENILINNVIKWKLEERKILADVFCNYRKEIIPIWSWWETQIDYKKIQLILKLSDTEIKRCTNNLKYMVKNFEKWILD